MAIIFGSHRSVIKDDDLITTKIRPAFNCSLKVRNAPSLNEAIYPGINLLNDLLDLLLYFRSNSHVFMADIHFNDKIFSSLISILMIKLISEVDKNRFCFFEGENVVCFIFGFNDVCFILFLLYFIFGFNDVCFILFLSMCAENVMCFIFGFNDKSFYGFMVFMIKLKSEVKFFVREGENVVCFIFRFVGCPFILNFLIQFLLEFQNSLVLSVLGICKTISM